MRQASGVKPLVLIPLSKASFNVIPGLHFNCSKKTIMINFREEQQLVSNLTLSQNTQMTTKEGKEAQRAVWLNCKNLS